jgi:excisionase family DNA binding protein
MKTKLIEPELISQTIAAGRLGVSLSTVKRMVADGELKTIKIRGRTMIPMTEIGRLVAR